MRMRPMTVRMYEREAVVEAIRRLLDGAFAGRGGTMFVVAPAGLGKTSVPRAAVAEAEGRFDVRRCGGDAVEAALPSTEGLAGYSDPSGRVLTFATSARLCAAWSSTSLPTATWTSRRSGTPSGTV